MGYRVKIQKPKRKIGGTRIKQKYLSWKSRKAADGKNPKAGGAWESRRDVSGKQSEEQLLVLVCNPVSLNSLAPPSNSAAGGLPRRCF